MREHVWKLLTAPLPIAQYRFLTSSFVRSISTILGSHRVCSPDPLVTHHLLRTQHWPHRSTTVGPWINSDLGGCGMLGGGFGAWTGESVGSWGKINYVGRMVPGRILKFSLTRRCICATFRREVISVTVCCVDCSCKVVPNVYFNVGETVTFVTYGSRSQPIICKIQR